MAKCWPSAAPALHFLHGTSIASVIKMVGYVFAAFNSSVVAAQRRDAAISDMKMREGSIASSVSLTFRKWLFHILINKRPNLRSAQHPVNWKLFEGEYETHIHYGRTYFLPLITTKSNDISVWLLSHMQIVFTSFTLLCVVCFCFRRSLILSNASLSFSPSLWKSIHLLSCHLN